MVTGIDLFAGGGGTTTGAVQAGVNMLWAANHNPAAMRFHALNHPDVLHVSQDLQQADWSLTPSHDILFASPCCQGHSKAAGKGKVSKKADVSRSTAWAVVSCAEYHRAPIAIVENVEEFTKWDLFPSWRMAMEALGYSLSLNILNAADFGAPQSRKRLFIVCTLSANPISLKFDLVDRVPASSIIDLNTEGYKWDKVSSRVLNTQRRVAVGRQRFGDVFLDAAYSSDTGGRSLDKPIGTITTVNKHSLVVGDMIRPITISEMAAAQTFPTDYQWPTQTTVTKLLIGNAVPPLMARKVTEAVLAAA